MRVPRQNGAGGRRRLLALGGGVVALLAAVAITLGVARLLGPGDPGEPPPREAAGAAGAAGAAEKPPEAIASPPARAETVPPPEPPEPPRPDPSFPAAPDTEAAETARMIEALLDDLNSPTRMDRMKALEALGRLAHRSGGEAVVPLLVEGAGDEDPSVRCWAVRALATVGPRAAPAVPALRGLMRDPAGLMVARPAVEALGRIGPAATDAVDDLVPLLSDHIRSCELASAESLAAIGGKGLEAVAAHVEALLGGADGAHLEKKIEAMGVGGRAAVPTLLKWIEERQAYAKKPNIVSIANAFARIGPEAEGAVDTLEKLAAERDPATYGSAIYALLSVAPARVDAGAAAADLVQDLGRNMYWDFDPAAKALGMIGEPAVEPVLAALRSGTGRMRRQACAALGEMGAGAERLVPELVEEARTSGPEVRPHVLRALGRIGARPDEVVPLLVGFLDDPKSRHAAAAALGDLGAKAEAAIGELRKRLDHADETARSYYEAAIRRIERDLERRAEEPEPEGDVF